MREHIPGLTGVLLFASAIAILVYGWSAALVYHTISLDVFFSLIAISFVLGTLVYPSVILLSFANLRAEKTNKEST